MLYRKINILYKTVVCSEFFNEFIRDLIRIAIKQSYPRNRRIGTYFANKAGERILFVQIKPVTR